MIYGFIGIAFIIAPAGISATYQSLFQWTALLPAPALIIGIFAGLGFVTLFDSFMKIN